ncbi:hypothetical protein TL16_g09111 [Triparma laevis f. inornata]|uniref:RING-type domain-containing protein n=1 Tax=Triparma laevis f. inornata TaxID=1714386 RepID=A0A9W7B4K8_9STRA|nr:hypothetical protein TL16_g09111 [Triparma laevis f. inornata]
MMSAPVPLVPLEGSVICLVNVPDAQMHPCGHSMICRYCTQELMNRSEPCPICRKPLVGFDVGVYSGSLGERGLWLTSARNLRELARNYGFNEYFQKQFNGNEATFLKWKEVFDVLEIVGGRGIHCTVRESMEQQVLRITRSEDLVKLGALAKLCSRDFFEDPWLWVVAWRRILEVLELAMPEEKKVRGKKKKQQRKLEVLHACFALGAACGFVEDFDDAKGYYKRAKEGYEEQLGRDSEKALETTYSFIMGAVMSDVEKIEKLRDLVKKKERALGEENVVTLETLNSLGVQPKVNGEYEAAIKVLDRCLAGRMKALGEDHQQTLMTLKMLGVVYRTLKNCEKELEYYERALKGYEKKLGKNHPSTLDTMMNIAIVNRGGMNDYGKAEELYERALEGYEPQFGRDHEYTKRCAKNFKICLEVIGNIERLTQHIAC